MSLDLAHTEADDRAVRHIDRQRRAASQEGCNYRGFLGGSDRGKPPDPPVGQAVRLGALSATPPAAWSVFALLPPESPPIWRDPWTQRHGGGISRHFSRQNGGLVRSGSSTLAPCAHGDAHAFSGGPCANVRADFLDKTLDSLYTHERDEHRTRRGGGLPEVSA